MVFIFAWAGQTSDGYPLFYLLGNDGSVWTVDPRAGMNAKPKQITDKA